MRSLLYAMLLGAVAAVPNYGESKLCSSFKKKVTAVRQQAQASAYCSGFLAGGTTTTTVYTAATTTSYSTVPAPTVLSVPPECSTVFGTKAKRTAEPALEAPEASVTPGPILDARGSSKYKKPSCFDPYKKKELISSACKCLGITTGAPKSTVTSTSTTTTETVTTTTTTGVASTARTFVLRGSNTAGDPQIAFAVQEGAGPNAHLEFSTERIRSTALRLRLAAQTCDLTLAQLSGEFSPNSPACFKEDVVGYVYICRQDDTVSQRVSCRYDASEGDLRCLRRSVGAEFTSGRLNDLRSWYIPADDDMSYRVEALP